MGAMALKAVSKKDKDEIEKTTYSSVFDIPVRLLLEASGSTKLLSEICADKKAVLFVNVASKWGLTDKNYK